MLVLYQQSCSRQERSHWVCKYLVHRHHRLSQLATGLQDLGTTKLMVTTWMEVSMHLDSRWLKDNLLRYCVGGACLMMLHEKCHGNCIYSKWGIEACDSLRMGLFGCLFTWLPAALGAGWDRKEKWETKVSPGFPFLLSCFPGSCFASEL